MTYPNRAEELQILERFAMEETQPLHTVATLAEVRRWREEARAIHIDGKLKRYIVELVAITRERESHFIDYGASPRATLAIANLARAKALLAERDYAVPDDVRAVAPLALRHRIGFNFRVTTENVGAAKILDRLIASVPTP